MKIQHNKKKFAISLFCALTILSSSSNYWVNCEPATAATAKGGLENTTILAVKCDITKASEENANLCPRDSSCIEFGATGSCVCRNQTQKINENYTKEDKNSSYCIARNEIPSHTTTTTTHAPAISSTQAPSIQSTASVQPPPPPTSATNKKAPETITTAAAPSLNSSSTTTTKPIASTEKITVAPKIETSTNNAAKASNDTSKHKDDDNNSSGNAKGHFMSGFGLPLLIVVAFICTVFAVRKYDLLERAQNYIRNRGTQQPQTRYDGLENDFDDDPLLI